MKHRDVTEPAVERAVGFYGQLPQCHTAAERYRQNLEVHKYALEGCRWNGTTDAQKKEIGRELFRLISSFPNNRNKVARSRMYWILLVRFCGQDTAAKMFLSQIQPKEGCTLDIDATALELARGCEQFSFDRAVNYVRRHVEAAHENDVAGAQRKRHNTGSVGTAVSAA